MRRAALVALLACLFPGGARAYTQVVQMQGAQFVRLHWPDRAFPVHFRLNEQIGPALPNVTDDSDPMGAVNRALDKWPAAAAISFTTSTTGIASGGRDRANVISFADTSANRSTFEMAGGPIGLTLFFFEGENLIEADVLFNPGVTFTTTIDSQSELQALGQVDVEAVALHELGHAIGLHHTGVESAAMWALTSVGQRTLDPDDVAGARTLYPAEDERARIDGTVRVDGITAFGAHVVAVSAAGPVISALTLPNGQYAIENLPPDNYTVYVEPLDGPHTSVPADACVRFGNMAGGGIYSGATLTTNFRTTFFGGAAHPTVIALGAAESAIADFELASGTNAVNPTLIGPATVNDGSIGFSVGGTALDLAAGTEQWVAIAGPEVGQVAGADIAVLGDGVLVDAGSRRVGEIRCPGQPLPVLVFRTTTTRDAVAGGYTILLTAGGDRSAFTGALRVRAADRPPTPTPTVTRTVTPRPTNTPTGPVPCVGDCNQDDAVTIDELIRGVTIALGTTAIESCPDFDSNGDGQVAINELVQAVNAALQGCLA